MIGRLDHFMNRMITDMFGFLLKLEFSFLNEEDLGAFLR